MNAAQIELQECHLLLSILANKITLLEQLIAPQEAQAWNKNDDLFQAQTGAGNKNQSLFPAPIDAGNKKEDLFHAQPGAGNKKESLFQAPIGAGNKKDDLFPAPKSTGNKNENFFQAQTGAGNKNEDLFPAATPAGNKELPQLAQLYQVLRKGELYGGMQKSITNVARVLLHIAAQPTGNGQRQLAQMLGMSTGGIAKFMMALFRRQLITRVGYQHYQLTPKAAGFLQEAAQLPDEQAAG